METKTKTGIRGTFHLGVYNEDTMVSSQEFENKILDFKLEAIAKIVVGDLTDTSKIIDGKLILSDAQTIEELDTGNFQTFKVNPLSRTLDKNEITSLFQVYENEAQFIIRSFSIENSLGDTILAFKKLPIAVDKSIGGEFEGQRIIVTRNERIEG